MKLMKIKAIAPNRFKLVDAGGITIGIIEITQVGLHADIKIVEKGEHYQTFAIHNGGV